jgi:hypothetical protein
LKRWGFAAQAKGGVVRRGDWLAPGLLPGVHQKGALSIALVVLTQVGAGAPMEG